MIVLKFGGTSVSSKNNIEQIKSILLQKNDHFIVVVSAFSGITNSLETIAKKGLKEDVNDLIEQYKLVHFNLIKQLFKSDIQTHIIKEVDIKCADLIAITNSIRVLKELSNRTLANVLSFGERLSAFIIWRYLQEENVDIELLDSRKLIKAEGDFLKADVDFEISNKQILEHIKAKNYISGGFIGTNNKNEIVNLGRGGSDYTASIYASALNASKLEIWSDVNGLHSANPNKVSNTFTLNKLSYQEAFEMAYFGAKVLYPPSILPVMSKGIPLYLKNTFEPNNIGTQIQDSNKSSKHKIQGLSSLNSIVMLTVSGIGLAKHKGSARKVFQILEEQNINIILITQSCSEQSIGIGIKQSKLEKAEQALNNAFKDEINKGLMNRVKFIKDQCIIALIGDNMQNKVGLSGKIFSTLGENGINITAIAQGASERNISIVIDEKNETKALNLIHGKFFSTTLKTVNLFIAGVGNVGNAFLDILNSQKQKLIENYRIHLKIIGVTNSSKIVFNNGAELKKNEIEKIKEIGVPYDNIEDSLRSFKELNLANSVFIDNTASEIVSKNYSYLLENSISIVTCNKIACSDSYKYYNNLNKTANAHNCHFKYETSVGAALPIIKTIKDLLISGDEITKIEAVISGSLSFIFNEYTGKTPFADVVLKAKNEGYTEPDPKIDLSGLDVMRKLLILSRESGLKTEMNDITFNSFLPLDCVETETVDDFFIKLKANENHFKKMVNQAQEKGAKLNVVATLKNKQLTVALKEITHDSPFYSLQGKDNIVAINTNRYANEPLVIKGAGAGSDITASGVFADLMYIMNR